ncbi:MAG: hypothetical protein RIT04_179 [Candidatus Parcubacteria bacterium]|jgi:antitoxin component of RelBE/YafQ-DinJ toxin-antitoxin module
MKTIINIKADKDIKDLAMRTAKDMGVPLSTIVNALLRQFVANRSVVLTAAPTPSAHIEKVLKQAEKDIRSGKNLSPLFTEIADMDEYLARL